MRIGINGSGQLVTPDLGGLTADVTAAEADGFSSYWLAQSGGVDALTVFAAHGDTGSATQLGTAVIPTWVVHPQVLAGQALTTQAAIGNRLVLGLGLSHEPAVEGRWKMTWERPVRQMLDFLDVLQPLLTEGRASHAGYFWSFEGESARCTDVPPKVMIAALGEQMLKVAGTRTDGTILWCVGPKTIAEHIAPVLNTAAAQAGRPTPSIVCSIPVWVTDDPQPARDFLGTILANYAELPSYRRMLDIEGLHGLGELSIVGSEAEVAAGIAAVAASGATDFTAVPMGGNPDEIARTRAALLGAAIT
ncbi:MAG TPA: TIGR03564 family F420-dependent LLM class oxidoreductase [Acidimicrobiales bacterium]|nr:TIGR03564 family F420-dependent LLM class oxidoreductase [Acidimicrobiales bacterium]